MTMPQSVPHSVKEAIESRRSVRKFASQAVPEADLRELIRQASLAPTANNVQTARFVVITAPELKNKLQAVSYNQAQVGQAPAVIVIYSDMEDTLQTAEETVHPAMGEEQVRSRAARLREQFAGQDVAQRGQWGLAQANITFGFLLLAMRGMGYDGVPMLGFEPDKVRALLNLPEHAQMVGLLPLGIRAEEGFPHHRHSVDRIAKFL